MTDVKNRIEELIVNARAAAAQFKKYEQTQVDSIIAAMEKAGTANERKLAEMAVEETGMGKVEDKVVKNHIGCHVVYEYLKDKPSVGIISENDGIIEIAEPFGIVVAVTPTTNPTSTTMFKALISLKGRNVIVFAFHPRAQGCSAAAATLLRDAAIAAGAPQNCIQWIEEPSIEATNLLITHPKVNLVIATGGGALVKAAYSSGHPALGVGPGNVPVYVEKTANLSMAVNNIIASKTFDHGTLCSADQSVIFDDENIAEKALRMFAERGAFICSEDEKSKLAKVMFDEEKGVPSQKIIGQSPQVIARLAGFDVPDDTKLLMVPLDVSRIGPEDMLSHEKLSPVLGYMVARGKDEAIATCIKQLEFGGAGHTATCYSHDDEVLKEFSLAVPANRVVLNAPSAHGSVGQLYNELVPSMTLGCGTAGGNVTTDNINYRHLLNIKRAALRNKPETEDE
ncbi:MAG: aldehyde dehydrogenase family protein [Syntrophotaleaceae bacterium]